MKKSKKRVFKKLVLILITLGLLAIHFYFPRFIVEINNPLLRAIKKPVASNRIQPEGKGVIFKSFDETELSAFLTYSDSDTVKGTIILLHGIRSNKEHFIKLSNILSDFGYNSVALDLRAHGESKGKYCTFGVKEKFDIVELINVLESSEKIAGNIGIWGQSLGGAVGIQAMGIDKRIKFGIIESTFSDFKTITNDYFNYHLGFNIKVFTNYLINRAGKIAEFDPDNASPSLYCKKISQPIIIVHGSKDKRINIKYAKENFSKIKSVDKEFLDFKNANQINVWETGGDQYFEKVIMFMDKVTAKK